MMLYACIIFLLLLIGLSEQNAVMCCAAGLFAIAAEIQARKGSDDG